MACIKNLKDLISLPAMSTGVWTFEGAASNPLPIGTQGVNYSYGEYSPFSSTPTLVGDIISNTGNLTNATFNPGEGWNGLANSDTIISSLGYYHMDFHLEGLGGCITRATIQVVRNICSGGDSVATICDSDLLVDIDIRDTLWAESPCSGQSPPSQETPHDNAITYLGETSVITDDNASGAMYIVNMGNNQHEWIDVSLLTVDGVFNYTNTVNINPAYTYNCTDCNGTEASTYTLTRIVGTAGDIVYDPYLVVCDNAACSVSTETTLSGEKPSGQWFYLGVQLGDVGTPNIINQDVFMSVASNPGYQSYSQGTQVSITHNDTFFLDQATINTTYAFEYVVNIGTPCADTEVIYIRLEENSDAGTAPPSETLCYFDYLAGTLGGNTIYNLFGALTGTPNVNGVWTVTVNDTNGQSIAYAESFYNNTNHTYDFSWLDDVDNALSITFNYTHSTTGVVACVACASTDTSEWTIKLAGGCEVYADNSLNSPYYDELHAYQWNGTNVNFYDDLMNPIGTCGKDWRISGFYTADLPLIGLEVDEGGGFLPESPLNNGNSVTNVFNAGLNFDNVPAGIYGFFNEMGKFHTIDGANINCINQVRVFVEVINTCTGSCINTVVSDNKSRQMTDLQLEDFTFLSAQGGFNFPYGLEFTAQMDLFISDYKTWIEAQGCIVTSTASYYMDIANNLTYLYLDADQGGVGEHKNITIDGPVATINFNNPVDCVPCATSVAIVDNTDGTLTAATGSCTTPAYLWSPNGETTQTITMGDAGTYTVDITCTENGCTATNSFTCNADCGGGFKTFVYRDDWLFQNVAADADYTKRVTSFIVDGVEYVPGNVILADGYTVNQSSIVSSDGHNYFYKDIVDNLNAIGIPGVTFDYMPDLFARAAPFDSDTHHRFIKITYPSCQTFTYICETFVLGVLSPGDHSETLTESNYFIGGSSHNPGDLPNISAEAVSGLEPAMSVATTFYDCT